MQNNDGISFNYFCTWSMMEWLPENCGKKGLAPRDILCDELLFGEDGIALKLYPGVRQKLYFMIDDGWEVKSSRGGTLDEEKWLRPYIGSGQLWEEKFPGYGDTYRERLKTLSDKIKAAGWKGLGLWISPTVPYGRDVEDREKDFLDYWAVRLEWSRYAGVAYWKIDWGDYDISDKYKRALYDLKTEIYPALIFENAFVRSPINEKKREGGIPLTANRSRLSYSDVLRTYDVTFPLSLPTTLSRVCSLLRYPPEMRGGAAGIINGEDEVYIDASLGLSLGIMRYPIGSNDIASGPNIAFGGTGVFPGMRPVRRQLDEAARAVNWETIAPAFGIMYGNTSVSQQENTDDWRYTPDQTWKNYFNREYLVQCAPRITARNVNPPQFVDKLAEWEYPYICASRNPNGSLSVASLGRVRKERGYYLPPADVIWDIGPVSGEIAVFGRFATLTLIADRDLSDSRIFAGDLLDGELSDITSEVKLGGRQLLIPGETIAKYGLLAASEGDLSEPGMLLRIGKTGDLKKVDTLPAVPKAPPLDALLRSFLRVAAHFHVKKKRAEHKKKLRAADNG